MKPKEIIAEIMDRIPCVDRPGHNMLAHEIVKKLAAGGYVIAPKEPTQVEGELLSRVGDLERRVEKLEKASQ